MMFRSKSSVSLVLATLFSAARVLQADSGINDLLQSLESAEMNSGDFEFVPNDVSKSTLDQFMSKEMMTNYGAPQKANCGRDEELPKAPRFKTALDLELHEYEMFGKEAHCAYSPDVESKKKCQLKKIQDSMETFPIVLHVHDKNKLSKIEKKWLPYYDPINRDDFFHQQALLYDNHTMGYVNFMEKERRIIVAFHGTNMIQNWITNVNSKIDYLHHQNNNTWKVHHGFYTAALRSHSVIVSILDEWSASHKVDLHDFEIFYTGHSLGGALATMGSTLLYLDNSYNFAKCGLNANFHNQIKTVSFAAPMVFSKESAVKFPLRHENHIRFVHPQDIVPLLPGTILNYHHTGVEAHTYPISKEESKKVKALDMPAAQMEQKLLRERLEKLKEIEQSNMRFSELINAPAKTAFKLIKQIITSAWNMDKMTGVMLILRPLINAYAFGARILSQLFRFVNDASSVLSHHNMSAYVENIKLNRLLLPKWVSESSLMVSSKDKAKPIPELNQCNPAKLSKLLADFTETRNVFNEVNNAQVFKDGSMEAADIVFGKKSGVTCVSSAGGMNQSEHEITCYYIPVGSANLKTDAHVMFKYSAYASRKQCYEQRTDVPPLPKGPRLEAEVCLAATIDSAFTQTYLDFSFNDYKLFKAGNMQSQCVELQTSILSNDKCVLDLKTGFEPLMNILKARLYDNILWRAYKSPVELIKPDVCRKYSLAGYWENLQKSLAPPSENLLDQVEMGFISQHPYSRLLESYSVKRLAAIKLRKSMFGNSNKFAFLESSARADEEDLPPSIMHKNYFPLLEAIPQMSFLLCLRTNAIPWIDCTKKEYQDYPNLCPRHCHSSEFANDKDAENSGRYLFCRRVRACQGALAPTISSGKRDSDALFLSFTEGKANELDLLTTKRVRRFFKTLSNDDGKNIYNHHSVFIELEEKVEQPLKPVASIEKESRQNGTRAFLSFSFIDSAIEKSRIVAAEKVKSSIGEVSNKQFEWLKCITEERIKGLKKIVYPTIVNSSLVYYAESMNRVFDLILNPKGGDEASIAMNKTEIVNWKETRIKDYGKKYLNMSSVTDEIPEFSILTYAENFIVGNMTFSGSVEQNVIKDSPFWARSILMRKVMMKYMYASVRSLSLTFSIFKTGNFDFGASELKYRLDAMDQACSRTFYSMESLTSFRHFDYESAFDHSAGIVIDCVLSALDLTERDIKNMNRVYLRDLLQGGKSIFKDPFMKAMKHPADKVVKNDAALYASIMLDLDRMQPVGVFEAMAFQNVINDFTYKAVLAAYNEGYNGSFADHAFKSLDTLQGLLFEKALPKLFETQIYNGEFTITSNSLASFAKQIANGNLKAYNDLLAELKKNNDQEALTRAKENRPENTFVENVRLTDALKHLLQGRAALVFREILYRDIVEKTIESFKINVRSGFVSKVLHTLDNFEMTQKNDKMTILPMPLDLTNQGMVMYLYFGKTMGLALDFSYVALHSDAGSDVLHLGIRMKYSMAEYMGVHSWKYAERTANAIALGVTIVVSLTPAGGATVPIFLTNFMAAHGIAATSFLHGAVTCIAHQANAGRVLRYASGLSRFSRKLSAGFMPASSEEAIEFSYKSFVSFNAIIYHTSELNEYLRYGNAKSLGKKVNVAWLGLRESNLRGIGQQSVEMSINMVRFLKAAKELAVVYKKLSIVMPRLINSFNDAIEVSELKDNLAMEKVVHGADEVIKKVLSGNPHMSAEAVHAAHAINDAFVHATEAVHSGAAFMEHALNILHHIAL